MDVVDKTCIRYEYLADSEYNNGAVLITIYSNTLCAASEPKKTKCESHLSQPTK